MMLSFLNESAIPYVIVGTKTDKLNATERRKFTELIEGCDEARGTLELIPFSSKNGEGRDALWRTILSSWELT